MTGTFAFIAMATPLLVFVLPVLAVAGAYFLRFYLATSKVFAVPLSNSAERVHTIFSNSENSNSDPNLRFVSLHQVHEIFLTWLSAIPTIRDHSFWTYHREGVAHRPFSERRTPLLSTNPKESSTTASQAAGRYPSLN
jgi:hypothetical protein